LQHRGQNLELRQSVARVSIPRNAGFLLPISLSIGNKPLAARQLRYDKKARWGNPVLPPVPGWGLLPCENDAAHDSNAQKPTVRRRLGERVKSTISAL
jgi:hypothetical protein